MRTTINIKDNLLETASQLTGIKEKTALVRLGLEALIAQESAKRLAKLGATEKKLKMAAAKLGCPFILMTSDKTTVGQNSNLIGGTQAIKKGLAYKY